MTQIRSLLSMSSDDSGCARCVASEIPYRGASASARGSAGRSARASVPADRTTKRPGVASRRARANCSAKGLRMMLPWQTNNTELVSFAGTSSARTPSDRAIRRRTYVSAVPADSPAQSRSASTTDPGTNRFARAITNQRPPRRDASVPIPCRRVRSARG